MKKDVNDQLIELADNLTKFISDLDSYIHKSKYQNHDDDHDYDHDDDQYQVKTKCQYIPKEKSDDGRDHLKCCHIMAPLNGKSRGQGKGKGKVKGKGNGKGKVKGKDKKSGKNREVVDGKIVKKNINGQIMSKWGDKWLPVCDGAGFPYVRGCFSDMSNWTSGPKQCIIENPGTTNLANGSLYTCGFLW